MSAVRDILEQMNMTNSRLLHLAGVARNYLIRMTSKTLSILIVVTMVSGPAARAKTSSEGTSHAANLFSPYLATRVPEPRIANSSRIDTLFKDGKIMLSLGDAIALALENNLDLAIAR